jgi:tol-pal system protein YbgF
MRYPVLALILLGALAPAAAMAQDQSVEQRLQRVERILRSQSLSDIVMRLEALQQEVQQLRGQLELQAHEMEAQKKRQRELYLDIDRRLSEGGSPAASTPGERGAPPPLAEPMAPADPLAEPPPSPKPAAVSADPAAEAAAYDKAFGLLNERRYGKAADAFRNFLVLYPNGEYADNAQYWLGEASYVGRDFSAALSEFSKVIQNFPTSPKVPDAMLKTGFLYYEQGEWAKAREALSRVRRDYPGTSAARLAAQRLERMRRDGY